MSRKQRREQARNRKEYRQEQQRLMSSFASQTNAPMFQRRDVGGNASAFRADTIPFLTNLFPNGWEYDPSVDQENKGWYGADTKFVNIGETIAEEILNYHMYQHQRSISEDHIADLAKTIQEAIDVALAVGPDRHPVLVNGQHTLWAISFKQKSIRCRVTLYQCRDAHAIANLYGIFDSNKRRTPNQVVKAQIDGGFISTNVPAHKLNKWTAHALAAMAGFKRPKTDRTNSARISAASSAEVLAFAQFMEELTTGVNAATARTLVRQGAGAAFFAMFISDKERAAEFIRHYLAGSNLDSSHPCFALRERMIRLEYAHADVMMPIYAGWVYNCWRKFCLNQPVRVVRDCSTDLPRYDAWKIIGLSEQAPQVVNTESQQQIYSESEAK